MTIFDLKMTVKSGLDFFYSSELLLPSAKNWPGRLAGISEGARSLSILRQFFKPKSVIP